MKSDPPSASATDFVLSQTDGQPMYSQLVQQVRERVAVGDWPSAMKLPSIREMAVALNISAITVKRAYLELEREGIIVTQQGRGSWVADRTDPRALQIEELERYLDRAAELARSMDMSVEEVAQMLNQRVRSGRRY